MRHHTATTCACCGQRSLQLTTDDEAHRNGAAPAPQASARVMAGANVMAGASGRASRQVAVETPRGEAAGFGDETSEPERALAPELGPEPGPELEPEPDAALADAILLAEDLAQRADAAYADAPLTFLTLALSRQLTLAADFADAGVDVRMLRRGLRTRVETGAFRSRGNRDHEGAIVDLLIATAVTSATGTEGAGTVTACNLIGALARCQRKHPVLDLVAGRSDATIAADRGANRGANRGADAAADGLSADPMEALAEAPGTAIHTDRTPASRHGTAEATARSRLPSCSAQIDDLVSINRRLEDRIAAMEQSLADLTRQLSAMQRSESRWCQADDGETRRRASDNSETHSGGRVGARVGAHDDVVTGSNRSSRRWPRSSRNRRSARLKRWWSRGRTRTVATSARGFAGRFHREQRSRLRAHRETREAGPRFHLQLDDPVVDAPSIGPKTAARLERVGVWTVRDLLKANVVDVSERVGMRHITADRLRDWQDQARLVLTVPSLRGTHAQLLVGAGFRAAQELAGTDIADVLASVLRFSQTRDGQRVLRDGEPPADDKIRAWVAAAQNCEPQRAQL